MAVHWGGRGPGHMSRLTKIDGGDPDWSSVVLLGGFDTALEDESSFARTITGVLTPRQTTGGKFGVGYVEGNGTSTRHAYCDDSADFDFGAGNFTIEGFVQWATVSASFEVCMAKWDSTGQRSWYLGRNAGNIVLGLSGDGTAVTSAASAAWVPSTSVWYHVAADFDGTAYRTYADGVMLGKSTTLVSPFASTAKFGFGVSFASGVMAANGARFLDEVRITKGVARYASDSGFTVPTEAYPRG